jgi:hypothetical protein
MATKRLFGVFTRQFVQPIKKVAQQDVAKLTAYLETESARQYPKKIPMIQRKSSFIWCLMLE